MTGTEHVRVLIAGGGPAGYTAAVYAARLGLEPVCLEGYESGGQLARTFKVENFPGIVPGISGADLSNRVREQALQFGATIRMDEVRSTDLREGRLEVVAAEATYLADALIVATGSRPRALGLPGEQELVGRGIAYCALCDGPFFAGQDVIVVGGGKAALDEALAMARVAAKVTLVHRRPQYRADAVLQAAVRAEPAIEQVIPAVVEALVEDERGLCGVQLRDLDSGELSYRAAEGLFVAIGHEPASAPFRPWLAMDDGRILTRPGSTATDVPGVFAAGDVTDGRYRQAVTAAASGCMAAIDAQRWLAWDERALRPGAAVGASH